MDYIIREAATKDIGGITDLFKQVDILHSETLPDTFVIPEHPARPKAYIEDILNDKKQKIFVACIYDKLLGFIHVAIRPTPPVFIVDKSLVIDAVVVEEEFQHKGVGKNLVEAAEQYANEQGIKYIILNVWKFNDQAIKFYETLGYTVESLRMGKRLS